MFNVWCFVSNLHDPCSAAVATIYFSAPVDLSLPTYERIFETSIPSRNVSSHYRPFSFGGRDQTSVISARVLLLFLTRYIYRISDAPAAIGPYSQAIKAGNLVFCSGCIPLDPSTGQVVPGGIHEQAEQALRNLKAVLEASGSSVGKVVKTTASHSSRDVILEDVDGIRVLRYS